MSFKVHMESFSNYFSYILYVVFCISLCRVWRQDSLDNVAIAAATAVWSERRREYRALLRQKRETFWKAKVISECSSPQQLLRSVDFLLGRDRIRSSPSITAEAMHAFFDAKVTGVRSSTENAPPPVFKQASVLHLNDMKKLKNEMRWKMNKQYEMELI